MTDSTPVSTGSSAVDEVLGGGLSRGTITQVYGPPAAGKSTLAMSSAVAAAGGGTAVYLDTEGLSFDRLEQIAADRDGETAALDRIMVTRAGTFDEQAARIRDVASVTDDLDLVVLDSATALYRLERTNEGDDGEALDRLGNQLAFLLSIARRYDLAVLATNQVFTDPDTDTIRPLGGETMAHWCGTIARLDRFRGPRRRFSLEKLRGDPADQVVMLELIDGGFAGLDVAPP